MQKKIVEDGTDDILLSKTENEIVVENMNLME